MATISKRANRDGSKSWVAWVRIKPFKPATKSFPSKKDAEGWADALERELQSKRKAVRHDLTKLTVAQLAREFLDDPETRSLRTYTSLEPLVLWWVNQYGSTRVLDLGVLTLREAREKLRPGRAPATVNRYLSAFRSCWNWGRASGLIPQERGWPTRLLLTEPKGRTRFLSDEELARLLEAAASDPVTRAAILVSLGCGVRQSELLRLQWSDVDFERQRVRILLSKNGESRSVFLPAAAADALHALQGQPRNGGQVFINATGELLNKAAIEYRWNSIREAAKLSDFRWHDLRHSCASFLAQNGANLLEIGSVLGHKSTSVTRRYSHLVEGAAVTGHSKLDEKLREKSS